VTDEAHQDLDEDRPPEGRFVAWLAGGEDWLASGIEVSSLRPAVVARAFGERLQEDPSALTLMLERLATVSNAESLLEAVLSQWWEKIRDSLPAFPCEPDSRYLAPDSLLVYLLLSLAPNLIHRFTSDDLTFLRDACVYDTNLLRHLLTWASAQPPDNRGGWHFEDRPPPNSIWAFEAQEVQLIFAARHESVGNSDFWWRFDWASDEGIALARRMIGSVDLAELLRVHGPDFFEGRLDLLVELATLDRSIARRAAADPAVIREFLEVATPKTLYPGRPLLGLDPRIVTVVLLLPIEQLESHLLTAGWAIGAALHAQRLPRSVDSVAQLFETSEEKVSGSSLCGVALLWADLRQLVEYEHEDSRKHQDQIRGVLARLSEHLNSRPDAWAVSTPEMLRQAEMLGPNAIDLLTLAAVHYPAVRRALEEVSDRGSDNGIRDRARGLLARVAGIPMPGDDLRRWLADSAARAFDGVPLFPHPLTPLTNTWLGSTEVEGTLSRSLRQAMVRFGDVARTQGAAQEEHLTGALLVELEVAFRDTSLRLESGGSPRLARIISVSQRPVPKAEEKRWGCDIALLLNADIRPSVLLRFAELVQVKKSEAFAMKSSSPDEKWRIDVPQLTTLLEMSESSSYWLILSTGELLCVTARWLHGLVRGRDALSQGSVTVGYNDVRHTAVPIEQFLPELFLGTWMGSLDEKTLKFANGDDSNVRPRYIFEISIVVSGDNERVAE